MAGGIVILILLYAAAFHWTPVLHVHGPHTTIANLLVHRPALRGIAAQLITLGEHTWVPDVKPYVEGLLFQREHIIESTSNF